MLRHRESDEVPELHNAVSQHFLTDDVTVILYSGLWYTLHEARKALGRKELLAAYRYVAGDQRLTVNTSKATDVVLGEIQNQWYLANGLDIPQQVMFYQERRLQEAVMAKAVEGESTPTTKAEKAPRVTSRSIIEQGLLAGQSDDKILQQVKKQFPDGKADQNHIRYYRHGLVKAGHLEPLPKQPRAKKEKPATLADAQAANAKPVKAQKTSSPTKATRSQPAKA